METELLSLWKSQWEGRASFGSSKLVNKLVILARFRHDFVHADDNVKKFELVKNWFCINTVMERINDSP